MINTHSGHIRPGIAAHVRTLRGSNGGWTGDLQPDELASVTEMSHCTAIRPFWFRAGWLGAGR